MRDLWILAQAGDAPEQIESQPTTEPQETVTVEGDPNAAAQPTRRPMPEWSSIVLLGLMFLVMYMILFRGPKKKQQQQQKMVQSLKKNDRVRTIGGIVGTVVKVEGDEITLKIDESNNTKMTIVASAIGRNLSAEKS